MNQDERGLAGGQSRSAALATEHRDVTLAEREGLGGDVPTPELSSRIEKGIWTPRMRPDRNLLDLLFDETAPNEAMTHTVVLDRDETRSALQRSVRTAQWSGKRWPAGKSPTQPQASGTWTAEYVGSLSIKVTDGWSSADLRGPGEDFATDLDLTSLSTSLGEPK